MTSIPADQLANVIPSVLAPNGAGVDVIGLVLTTNAQAPLGQVLSFPDADSVEAYFGGGSVGSIIAGGGSGKGTGYFGGFKNSTKLPGSILFAQYNADAVSAYLRGGAIGAVLTLAELQAISGTLSVAIDGLAFAAGSLNLSAATSFSNAADIIETALNGSVPNEASFTAAIAGTTLTVSAVGSGFLAVGQTLGGAGITASTKITAMLTGSGGTGTYTVNNSQTVASEAMTAAAACVVTYDSISEAFVVTSGITGVHSTIAYATGTVSDDLLLTSLTGAVLSQGAAPASPATFMNALVAVNRNWVTFMTAFDPDEGSGNTVKQAFAAWKNTQNKRFAYVCWDTDVTPTNTLPATSSLGYLLAQNGDEGTCLIYEPTDMNDAAFICGAAASIDFTERNGRISFAFKSQSGLVASVSNATVALNLAGNPQTPGSRGNGYNFYGAYGNANADFIWFQRGFVTGDFLWLDSYINQIWLNNLFQNALLTLQGNAKSIPYSISGTGLITTALADPIQAGLNFGAFGPATLSASQIANVNNSAGAIIAGTLQTQGYFLQILPGDAATRVGRTSPPAKFWYIDQGSVQAINLASVALQ